MKNLFDSSGMPIGAARHDVKEAMNKLAFEAYGKGLDAACDCFAQAFKSALASGHTELKLEEAIILVEELRKIAKKDF